MQHQRELCWLRPNPRHAAGEVATAVGIHRIHVLHIEAGRENITITTLYRLADHFGVPVSDLLAE